MNLSHKTFLSLCLVLSMNLAALAQDDLLDLLDSTALETQAPTVFATFKTTRIVNSHSVETVKRKSLDFRVTHHFGDVGGESGGVHTLYGLDAAADIRIAFEWGITDRFTVGAGRSKIGELLDGYAKYRLWQQTADNKVPLSTTLLLNAGLSPQRNLMGEYNNAAHRFSYTYQILLARKFTSRFSLQLMPTLLHRNYLFDPQDAHDLFAMGIGGRLKLSKRFALLADYFHVFSAYRTQRSNLYAAPLGLGVEIETGGHVFHMFFTNNAGIAENNYLPNTTSSWTKGEFKFGFNISRTFSLGRN